MKESLRALVRYAASKAPWGVREALFDGCLEQMRLGRVYARLMPVCKLAEIAASGDRGIVASSSNDTMVIVEYAQTGTFARTVTDTIADFFAPQGGTYIDVGANIGLMTIPFARDPRVRCVAFEPEPVNFGLLQRNVARNAPGSSAELHQIALYKSRGTLTLALAEGNIGDHRLTHGGVAGRRTIDIPAQPLDDFLDGISGPLAVKIDTQGAEPFVIEGGAQTLGRAQLLVMEFCPYLMRQLGGDPGIAIDLLMGFESIAIMRGGKAETPHYVNAMEAELRLLEKLKTAADTDEDYLDIIARRGPMRPTEAVGPSA